MDGFMIYISNEKGEWTDILHLPIRSDRWIKNHTRSLMKEGYTIEIHSGLFKYNEDEDYNLGDRIRLLDLWNSYSYKKGRFIR